MLHKVTYMQAIKNLSLLSCDISEALKGLVGEHNARRGSIKVFEAMQDVRLNKHLFYVCM